MTTKQESTAVGVFSSRGEADKAVDQLLKAGFSRDSIGVVARNEDGKTTTEHKSADGSYASEGAVTGVLAGAGVAGLVSLGITFGAIPVIGPVLAVGPLAAALISAVGGAAAAGLAGGLIGWGIPEHEAAYYEGEVQAGRYLVTVKAEGRRDEAWKILHQGGGYNYATASTAGRTATAAVGTTTASTAKKATDAEQTIKLHEEQLHARKERVQTGEVTLRKEVVTENRTIDVPVTREEIVIERHAVSGRAAAGDIKDGEVIRVPVSEEKVHLEKTAVVTEEVSVGKRKIQDTEHVSGTVRKEQVKVDQAGEVVVDSNTKSTKTK